MAITIKHFDILEFVNKAKAAGVDPEFAEYQARQMEQVIEVAIATIESKDLATKQDIELAIAHLKHDTLRFVVWTGMSVAFTLLVTLGGMLAKGFHWF
ncbi:MAG: hypothetical protein K2Y14_12965 [Burkholderiales bacterium]|nr:hypothetical protein [Burkholderiales bacterium]